jgi:DNA gyrase subunit A
LKKDLIKVWENPLVSIEGEMKRSYLEYSMSVIVSRALPDVRDGLKPVHRRILYAMAESGFDHNKPYKKSARIVGDVVAKYHPHGTEAVYETMVRMAQDFSMRSILVDGHGNFGSMDGDKPAAMRYTEARLSKIAHYLLMDYDKKTVAMQTNYDESLFEPVVLPTRYPNLLVNGASGIAVGMATNIPTHNLGEVIDACCALIDDPNLGVEDLMGYVPGPDFPTGGSIMGTRGIVSAYENGRGIITVRGKSHVEDVRKDRPAIIVTEIPYQVNKAKMLERIAELVNNKELDGISDLRDESDLKGVRVVIELKRGAMPEVVLNRLYAMTPLQTSFGINTLALLDGKPLQLGLKEILKAFIEFRYEVIVKRTQFFLYQAQIKAHLFLGLLVAIGSIDDVISLIKSSKNSEEARERLMAKFWPVSSVVTFYIGLLDQSLNSQAQEQGQGYQFSEEQAKAILALRLHRLTGLERDKLQQELQNLADEIQKLRDLLASSRSIYQLMKDEMLEVKTQFADPRRTLIEAGSGGVLPHEDLIQQEDMVVTLSVRGYIKRVSLDTYRSQRRGGRGRNAMTTYDEDVVAEVFMADTHTIILFFSTFGRAYAIKVYELPLGSAQSKGKPLLGLIPLEEGETLATFLPLLRENIGPDTSIIFVTSKGSVRRNALKDFLDIRTSGKNAIKLEGDEKLIAVRLAMADQDVLLSTLHGHSIRFAVSDLRVFNSRISTGVLGIRLRPGDVVVSMNILDADAYSMEQREWFLKLRAQRRRMVTEEELEEINALEPLEDCLDHPDFSESLFEEMASKEQMILSVSSKGFGKRSSAYAYRKTRRGGVGVAVMDLTRKTGDLVDAFPVVKDGGILLLTNNGNLLRCCVEDVRIAGRRTQGVILVRLEADENIVSAVPLPEDQSENEEGGAEGCLGLAQLAQQDVVEENGEKMAGMSMENKSSIDPMDTDIPGLHKEIQEDLE